MYNPATNNIDHATYPASLKSKSLASLRWIIQDCRETLAACPDSPKAGYYADEINYCAMEINSRK